MRKIFDKLLMVLVILACVGFTIFIGQNSFSTVVSNLGFLTVMVILCLIGMIAGHGKMGRIEKAFRKATQEIDGTFNGLDAKEGETPSLPEQLFGQEDLDTR